MMTMDAGLNDNKGLRTKWWQWTHD